MANKNSDKKCLHCSTSFSGEGEFCCHGCKAAYNIISSLKLKNFYKYIDNQIDRSDLNLQDKKFDDIDISEFIIEDDTSQDSKSTRYTLNLMVDDLHCPSCVWLIEEVLKKQPEIIHARLNMSTKRLVINWHGERFHGNKYVNLIRKLGYNVRSYDPNISSFEDRKKQQSLLVALAVAAFASGNIMLLSVSLWSTSQEVMGIATRDFIHLISAIIAIPTIIFSGRVFFASAFKALINGRSNMDVPISIAIILTALVSVWEWLNSAEHTYFDSVTMLTFFLLIGRYLDVRTRNKARSAVAEMVSYANNSAQKILDDGSVKMIPSSKLQIGDIIQVNAGDKIPIDGVIIGGKTEVDMSIINGESLPKEISKDDEVFAGTLNLGQTIKVKVTEISDKSLLSEIIKLIEKSEHTKTKYDLISDKAISLYSPIVYFSGIITLIFWYIFVDIAFKDAVIIAISVLIITCPCAFGLAVPTVQILSSGALFKRGIMLKNPNALEILSHVSTVIFDKTGTITLGRFELKNRSDISDADFDIAYSMAINSSHPYSKAISNVGV